MAENKLTAIEIKSKGAGRFGDGGGLWLVKSSKDAGKWLYIYTLNGKRREMGLGAWPLVSLVEARAGSDEPGKEGLGNRDKWRKLKAAGTDPIAARKAEQSAAQAQASFKLRDVAKRKFEVHKHNLRGGTKARWFSYLENHILCRIGDMDVRDLTPTIIADAIRPSWEKTPEAARKAMRNLRMVLQHALVHPECQSVNPAIVTTAIKEALPKHKKSEQKNIPSMPWQDVPAFYQSLDESRVGELALKVLLLTIGPRSKPIRYLNRKWLHLTHNTPHMVVPAEFMKGQDDSAKDFRCPLPPQAVELLLRIMPEEGELFFPTAGSKSDVISDATMARSLDRRQIEARPHGFRSSFRMWATSPNRLDHLPFEMDGVDMDSLPKAVVDSLLEARQIKAPVSRDLAERCIAHAVAADVEVAYDRGDYLEERYRVMCEWADFITHERTS